MQKKSLKARSLVQNSKRLQFIHGAHQDVPVVSKETEIAEAQRELPNPPSSTEIAEAQRELPNPPSSTEIAEAQREFSNTASSRVHVQLADKVTMSQ